jgi:hypothetical protein
MNDREIIDYQSRIKNDMPARWRSVLVGLLAIASVLFCLFACFAALDSAAYAKQWKQYGMDPAFGAQIEADVQAKRHRSGRRVRDHRDRVDLLLSVASATQEPRDRRSALAHEPAALEGRGPFR